VALPVVAAALGVRILILPWIVWHHRAMRVRTTKIHRAFRHAFPERGDQLVEADFDQYRWAMRDWKRLLRRYDFVQGYSTDPAIPMLAGKDYFAFEHGTLRDIPFENTAQGRLTAISYHLARHVFVTNFDCLENAHRLADNRVSLINHPYDEDHSLGVTGWETLRAELCAALDASFIFFFPTRHDWVLGTGYADKANDVFLRAFADLRRHGHKVGMVCCRWGANFGQSGELIAELGCASHVKWVDPMNMVRFERTARASHCVVDQFKLGAFGGVMFKAMAAGSPICTYLRDESIRRQYPEIPPVVNCRTTQEIVTRLSRLIETPGELAAMGRAGREWIKRHHGRDAVVNSQIDQYRRYDVTRWT